MIAAEDPIVEIAQKTLLIVDDEPKICDMLSRFFTARGFRTVIATSGHQALEFFLQETPQYVLLDIRMPDLSGLEILKTIKAYFPEAKVIMVTAVESQETAVEAMQLGASDYITKPFELDETSWARVFFSE